MPYRITISAAAPTERGIVLTLTAFEQETAPDTWTPLAGAPTQLTLNYADLRDILGTTDTVAERRAAMLRLVARHVHNLPFMLNHRAVLAIVELLPNGFPVTVPIGGTA